VGVMTPIGEVTSMGGVTFMGIMSSNMGVVTGMGVRIPIDNVTFMIVMITMDVETSTRVTSSIMGVVTSMVVWVSLITKGIISPIMGV